MMNKKEVIKLSKEILENILNDYGTSKFYDTPPYLEIEDSPYDDDVELDDEDLELYGEFKNWENSLVVYWKNISSVELLIKTILHEYQHYLQSPVWMKRHYTNGYNYNDHPYEVAAYNEEKYWEKYN